MNESTTLKIGVIGAGAMGSGIAQVAALNGHSVVIYDSNVSALDKAKTNLSLMLKKLEDKGKISSAVLIFDRLIFAHSLDSLSDCGLVIEAVVEILEVKKDLFNKLDAIVNSECILATNTSSLSVTSIAASSKLPTRVLGIHFFNPAPLMPLVEIIPAIQTDPSIVPSVQKLLSEWGKIPVVAKDTPGFIVNRVARPFYGEAIRILEEGIADMATIDWVMTEPSLGGFKMGPFTLMDFIGHDVNYVVTETVFKSFFFDPKYRPSFSQKRLLEAGWLGKKSGRGFYDYSENAEQPTPVKDIKQGKVVFERILVMLINEAVDALYLNVASAKDLDVSMTKGVNYPKGLLKWCDELGADYVLCKLDSLFNIYHDDRYRASYLLRKHAFDNRKFFV